MHTYKIWLSFFLWYKNIFKLWCLQEVLLINIQGVHFFLSRNSLNFPLSPGSKNTSYKLLTGAEIDQIWCIELCGGVRTTLMPLNIVAILSASVSVSVFGTVITDNISRYHCQDKSNVLKCSVMDNGAILNKTYVRLAKWTNFITFWSVFHWRNQNFPDLMVKCKSSLSGNLLPFFYQ